MEVEMEIKQQNIEETMKVDQVSIGHEGKDVGKELTMIDQIDTTSLSIQPQTPDLDQELTYKPNHELDNTPTKPKQTPTNQIKSRLPIPTSRSHSKPKSTPSPSTISFPSYALKNNNNKKIQTTPLNLITQPSSFPKSPRSPAPSRTPITSRTPNLSIKSNASNLTRSSRSPAPPRTPNLSNKSTASNLSKTCLTPTRPASSTSRTTPSNHQLKRPKSIHSMVNETHRFTNGQTPDELPTPVRSTTSMTNRSASKASSAKPTQSIREMLAEARKQKQKSPSKDHLSPQWGFQPIGKLIKKAHRTGRLNLGSRMMNEIPMRVYKDLIPSHSIFHPSNRAPTKTELKGKKQDEEKEKDELEEEEEKDELEEQEKDELQEEEEEEGEVKWYEKVDLTHLNVALNEISELDYELGGFDCLEHLDVHHNQLRSLPTSFGLLINLVQLNLSSNKFEELPLPLLSLVNLKELNLSNNLLKKLWEPNWDILLKKTLAKIGKQSKSNEKNNQEDTRRTSEISLINHQEEEEFFDFFPSSPSKRKKKKEMIELEKEEEIDKSLIPFPVLEKLFLGSNQFISSSIFGDKGIKLPNSLIELDLSKNPLREPIEIPRNLTELKVLKLGACGFDDCVFRFEVDSEYDQLSEDEGKEEEGNGNGKLFKNLEELDLSNNGIDSLGPLEGFLKQYCYQKRLEYVGLPKGIENVGGGSEEVLKVLVHENFLRNESRRRKAMKGIEISTPVALPTTEATTRTTSTEAKKQFDTIVEAVENLSLDTDEASKPSKPKKTVTPSRHDQINAMIKDGYHSESFTLDLHAQHIQDSDIREEVIELIEKNPIQKLNLSQNILNRIPFQWISASGTITSLNLSRNRLSNKDLENINDSLTNLIELNLSGNMFDVGKELFEWISKNAKRLKKLDLSYNGLKDEDGIESLWFLEEIDLRGNLMEELVGLVQVGKRMKELQEEEEEEDEERDELELLERDYKWKCIDLRDNHIVKLEPSLGYLSIDELFVSGNRFRVPLRKVYEGSDGTKKLLKWLKARYV